MLPGTSVFRSIVIFLSHVLQQCVQYLTTIEIIRGHALRSFGVSIPVAHYLSDRLGGFLHRFKAQGASFALNDSCPARVLHYDWAASRQITG